MEPIDFWILENSEKINLKITEYLWPADFYPELSDLSAEISIENKTFIGRGSDLDINTATRKAVVEAIERACAFFDGKRNSNGVAAHPIKDLAKKNATFELIERDAFLCHFLTSTPFEKVLESDLNFTSSEKNLIQKISAFGVKFHHLYLINEKNCVGTITIAIGMDCKVPWGICFGMSVKEDLQESLNKSLMECIRHVIPLLKTSAIETISEGDFSFLKEIAVENHFKLGLDLNYGDWFIKTFIGNASLNKLVTSTPFDIKFVDLTGILKKFDIPISCVVSTSDSLQPLFFGSTKDEFINFDRLKLFLTSKEIVSIQINYRPHPIC